MKDLITTIASLLLLLAFVMEFAGAQVVHDRLFQADLAVESFRDALKAEGGLSQENKERLVEALCGACGCQAGEVEVWAGQEAGTAGQGMMLSYTVRFPLKGIIAMGRFFGIGEEENRAWFTDDGWVVSQYALLPEGSETPDGPDEPPEGPEVPDRTGGPDEPAPPEPGEEAFP